jgi:2-hydroxychromene-2-carboxylate isomerase
MEENLADPAVLARLLREAGFQPEALLASAASDDTRAVYERNRLEAIAAGVFGSPSYILDGEVFWGQDRLDLLEDALASARAPFSPTPP